MKRHPSQPAADGFALIEALVALLLLAIALMGAAGALVQCMAGQRSALLQTQAADLASDLAEALRSARGAMAIAGEIQSWQARVARQLPQAAPSTVLRHTPPASDPSLLPVEQEIHLQWRSGQPLAQQLTLPISFSILEEEAE